MLNALAIVVLVTDRTSGARSTHHYNDSKLDRRRSASRAMQEAIAGNGIEWTSGGHDPIVIAPRK